MEQGEFENVLNDVEVRLDRLRSLYDQWFQGLERLEPTVARKEVDRRIYLLRRAQPRNTALRFRFQQVIQKYTTYTAYWQRVARQIEEGTYRRDVLRARRKREEARRQRGERVRGGGLDVDIDVELEEEPQGASATAVASGDGSGSASQSLLPSLPPDLLEDAVSAPPPPAAPPAPGVAIADAGSIAAASPQAPGAKPSAAPRAARPLSPFALSAFGPRKVGAKPGPPAPPLAPSSPTPPPLTPVPPAAARPAPTAPAAPSSPPRAVATATFSKPREQTVPSTGPNEDEMRRLFDQYLDARRRNNERIDNVRYDTVAKSIREMLPKLQSRHAGKRIGFEVVVKDGKVAIKPVPKG